MANGLIGVRVSIKDKAPYTQPAKGMLAIRVSISDKTILYPSFGLMRIVVQVSPNTSVNNTSNSAYTFFNT